ncbi:hypothetical protein NMG60_11034309 [Bertholletia excelsa]
MILTYKELCRKLVAFLMGSTFTWVRNASSLLISDENNSQPSIEPCMNGLEMARFALEILDGCRFCLKTIGEENMLVTDTLAAVFLMNWEHSMAVLSLDALDDETNQEMKPRMEICTCAHNLHGKITPQFFKDLSVNSRKKLGRILIQSIRSIVFQENKVDIDKVTSLCCLWVLEVLDCLCLDQCEEQELLEQFLSKSDFWPIWVLPDSCTGERSATLKTESISVGASRNHIFVAVIDKLISKIGADKVLTGFMSSTNTEEATKELIDSQACYSRAWLAAEVLCTWKWQGGSALSSFLPLLSAYGKSGNYSHKESLFNSLVNILLDGALVHGASGKWSLSYVWHVSYDEMESVEETYLRALASLLFTLFEDNIWDKEKAVLLFKLIVNKLFIGEAVTLNCLRILPLILSVLIRPLSIKYDKSNQEVQVDSQGNEMEDTIRDWLHRTLQLPPANTWQTGEEMEDWFQLVISCYPMSALAGMQELKPARDISATERSLLLELFRKQKHGTGSLAVANSLPTVHMVLSKLIVVSVGYCWMEFNEDDWEFVVYCLRFWIESAVVMMEEVAESVNEAISNSCVSSNSEVVLRKLEDHILILNPSCLRNATNALAAFSIFCVVGFWKEEDADNLKPLRTERWNLVKDRVLEGILRLFLSSGAAEVIAGSFCQEASSIIASSRHDHPHFWELVASAVVKSSSYARDKAVKSFELWGLNKGPISSLYAILYSTKPLPPMQFAAYVILSSEPVSNSSIIREDTASSLGVDTTDDQDSIGLDLSSEENVHLREEIYSMVEKLPLDILEMDLVALPRVNVFVAWSLLLSRLLSFPSSSPARERLVQHIQEHADSTILDFLFQHIPLELCLAHGMKKKDIEFPPVLSQAAAAASRAITNSSILFCVESIWPVGPEKLSSLAGAIFGLMLCILPAYVRGWFNEIRDRSTSSAIESFTKIWCSPPLITNELSQIKKASFTDENFSVSVSKSANEVVATYTKDETGMDLVIRLPASYPLRPVDVECARSLGISEVKRRKWLLSMLSFVRNQNGALAEAISIWKSNFDKEFEGVEECPICYSVIHTVNHSLPRLACKTCKHKFHSACLYKWFSTSHKSTCPLCQSPF